MSRSGNSLALILDLVKLEAEIERLDDLRDQIEALPGSVDASSEALQAELDAMEDSIRSRFGTGPDAISNVLLARKGQERASAARRFVRRRATGAVGGALERRYLWRRRPFGAGAPGGALRIGRTGSPLGRFIERT